MHASVAPAATPPPPPRLHADFGGAARPGLGRAPLHLLKGQQVGRAAELFCRLALAAAVRGRVGGRVGGAVGGVVGASVRARLDCPSPPPRLARRPAEARLRATHTLKHTHLNAQKAQAKVHWLV